MKKLYSFLAAGLIALSLTVCDDSEVATRNLIKAADNFEVNRRIVFYNGITDTYMLEIEGRCSIDLNQNNTAFNVICDVGNGNYKRHTLVLSDNVTAFVEQIEPNKVSKNFYRVTFKPSTIIPNIDVR
jgi:gene 64 protein